MIATGLKDQRCQHCKRLLFRAAGTDAVVEIKCTCGRLVLVRLTT